MVQGVPEQRPQGRHAQAAGGQQHAQSGPDGRALAPTFDDGADNAVFGTVGHHELDQRRVTPQRRAGVLPDGLEESRDQSAAAHEIVGRGFFAEPVGVEWPADRVPQFGCGSHFQRLRRNVTLTVHARLGRLPVVVRPRQWHEFQVGILLQVFDQGGAAADEGLLQFAGGTVADHSVVVSQRVLDGVVGAGANQDRIAGEPHPATAGVGGGAAEPVGRLDQQHVETFARGGISAGDTPAAGPDHQHIVFFGPVDFHSPNRIGTHQRRLLKELLRASKGSSWDCR